MSEDERMLGEIKGSCDGILRQMDDMQSRWEHWKADDLHRHSEFSAVLAELAVTQARYEGRLDHYERMQSRVWLMLWAIMAMVAGEVARHISEGWI